MNALMLLATASGNEDEGCIPMLTDLCQEYYNSCHFDPYDPTVVPTPTEEPEPTDEPTDEPTEEPSGSTREQIAAEVARIIDNMADGLEGKVLASYSVAQGWHDSTQYKKQDLLDAIKKAMVTGVGQYKLEDFEAEATTNGTVDIKKAARYAATAIAAFLGQSMVETITYDACDENNWDQIETGVIIKPTKWVPKERPAVYYRMASSCGQAGQDYTGDSYQCDDACPVDPNMKIVGQTQATWWGAPPPMFCGPKTDILDAGVWDPYTTPSGCGTTPYSGTVPTKYEDFVDFLQHESANQCGMYEGQQGGNWERDHSANTYGGNIMTSKTKSKRSDVEGCCWWGRGVIQTTGVCNFGKLNKNVGAGAKAAGLDALYGDIDFCQHPEKVCTGPSDLKWFAGFFYWMTEVQKYEWQEGDMNTKAEQRFNFKDAVVQLVDNNFDKIEDFTNHFSAIVNRGCANPTKDSAGKPKCPVSGEVLESEKRYWSTLHALNAFKLHEDDNIPTWAPK